jgi:hypothetical protein
MRPPPQETRRLAKSGPPALRLDRLSASLPGIKWVYPLGYAGLQKIHITNRYIGCINIYPKLACVSFFTYIRNRYFSKKRDTIRDSCK